MREAKRKYEERKPGCVQAQTFTRKASELKVLRNKILDRHRPSFTCTATRIRVTSPLKLRQVRRTYPPYK
jgi:hypothetical protein